eukprot:Platyproteum_vivax@DN8248_c0_g1_i1.p1
MSENVQKTKLLIYEHLLDIYSAEKVDDFIKRRLEMMREFTKKRQAILDKLNEDWTEFKMGKKEAVFDDFTANHAGEAFLRPEFQRLQLVAGSYYYLFERFPDLRTSFLREAEFIRDIWADSAWMESFQYWIKMYDYGVNIWPGIKWDISV